MNTTVISYILQILLIVNSFGLLGASICLKTKEKLTSVLWAILITILIFIGLIAATALLSCPIGLGMLIVWLFGLAGTFALLVAFIITLVRRKKIPTSEPPKPALWLYAYLIPVLAFASFVTMDYMATRNADIIIVVNNPSTMEPAEYYAISENGCHLMGIGTDFSSLTETKHPVYTQMESDYSDSANPNLKWVLFIQQDPTLEQIKASLKDAAAIGKVGIIKNRKESEKVAIYDIANSGYYWVQLYEETTPAGYPMNASQQFIFYKNNVIDTIDINDINTVLSNP